MKHFLPVFAFGIYCLSLPATAQMHSGSQMQDFNQVFGLVDKIGTPPYSVILVEASCPGNILYPGEQPTFSFLVRNNLDQPIKTSGKIDVISYGTRGIPGDVWIPQMVKFADLKSIPIDIDLAAKGTQLIEAKPILPDTFGAYAFVFDLGTEGRAFATTCVRTFAATEERIQFPRMSLDSTPGIPALKRLGIQGVRYGISFIPPTDPHYAERMAALAKDLQSFAENNITVLATLDATGGPQPLGRPRPWLNDDDVMQNTKSDMAPLPQCDPDFQKFVGDLCQQDGWPKGPITAVQLWNEPWDGISISGWGADDLRYRDLYTAMAKGVESARDTGTEVLITGCDSSSNSIDKLFPDGKDTFLKWFDACTLHYQGLASPSIYRKWLDKKGPQGRVQFWDTESWVANTDDRVAAVVAGDRAAGYDRVMGVFWANVSSHNNENVTLPDGTKRQVYTSFTWSTAASLAATIHFIGQRDFHELLFKNGLPWVILFDGLKQNADDGTMVVVGDLGDTFKQNGLLFRSVSGLANAAQREQLTKELKTLPADSPDRAALEKQLAATDRLSGGTMTIPNPTGEFVLYDFYGNPVTSQTGKIEVPLDTRGFFLRTTGVAGSFARLKAAVAASDIKGYEPVEIKAHDLIAPIETKPAMRLSVTNILDRPIKGNLQVTLGDLTLATPSDVSLQPNETKDILVPVSGGSPRPDNRYPLNVRFDAGEDGFATHLEDLHVNLIAKRTITIDGNLDDWKGVLPQTVRANTADQGPSLMESAWLPFSKFDASQKSGFATAYLAYDDKNFYFAAKVADDSPDPGTIRFEKRDDDSYFYPAVSHEYDAKQTLLKKDEIWNQPIHSADALLLPGSATERSYTAWSSISTSFAVDLDLPKETLHQVAFYFVDWDENPKGSRVQEVEIHDSASDKLLAKTTVNEFGRGKYAKFLLSGKVRVIVRSDRDWLSSSISGIFMDPGTVTDLPTGDASAKFIGIDETTGGTWSPTYGRDGYVIVGAPPHYPSYAQVNVPEVIRKTDHVWPDGVRRYSYRKEPELPFGSHPGFDNVQIAFNVIPEDQKANMIACPPGTMPGFVEYEDTDYEYALNAVAPAYGGGTEIWRCLAPGMVRKHFYPREPAGPLDGAVHDAQLVVKQDGNTRIEETAIPWSELPLVKAALDAGKTVKFSFRVNASHGPSMELAEGRSVSKTNCYTFHPDWIPHWANEIEFGFEK